MFKKIKINKFRSCRNVELSDLQNFLVFVGKNGVGKTNIFRSIFWASKQNSTGSLDVGALGLFELASIEFEIELGDYLLRYAISCSSQLNQTSSPPRVEYYVSERLTRMLPGGGIQNIFNRQDGKLTVGFNEVDLPIGETTMASAAVIALLPEHDFTQYVLRFKEFLQAVSYNHLDTPSTERTNQLIASQDFIKWQKNKENYSGGPSESELRLLDLKQRDPSRYQEVVDILKQMGIIANLEIITYAPDIHERPGFYFFQWTPQFYEEQTFREWSDLSFGTRRLINLFVSFFYQNDLVFMVEQPEDGIHAGLLNQVIPMLKNYAEDRQLFVASHSAEVMNAADPDQIRIVGSVNGFTAVRSLESDEITAACNFLREDGPLHNFISMIE